MSKKKIAVMMDWYLPGTKAGGPVRSVYSLMNLLKNDFDFYLISTNQDLGSQQPYKDVKANAWLEHGNIHYYYFSADTLNQKSMLALLQSIAPDLVYLNSFWSFNFSISLVNLKKSGHIKVPVLLAPRGMLGKGALGLKSFKKQLFLFLAKRLGWYKPIVFHATQQQEAADIRNKFANANVVVAPNVNALPSVDNKSVKTVDHLKLFFLSRIDRVKNLHMALECLKDVPSQYTITYDIFGNMENSDYWSECQKIIAQLPAHVTVSYKGELQFNEVQATICQYNALLLPTLNENFGHSIVESLLCGCPVIISDQTPWNDLEQHNAGYAIALNDRKKFLDALVSLAQLSPQDFALKSKAATNYIHQKIDLQAIHNHYKNLFNDCFKN